MQGSKLLIEFEFCKKKFYKIFKNMSFLQSQAKKFEKSIFKNFVHAFEDCRSS
jgi:hypothetical protein